MYCAIIIPVGPGHEQISEECVASVMTAYNFSKGPFEDIYIIKIDDTQGLHGRSAARNHGIKKALSYGAEWIFFLDSDDIIDKEIFQTIEPYLPHYDAIWGNIYEYQPSQGRVIKRTPQAEYIFSIKQLIDIDPFLTLQMGHFVRTEIASTIGFDESLNAGEDFDYYLRLWDQYRCAKLNIGLFINRRGIHSNGPKSATPQQWRENVSNIINNYKIKVNNQAKCGDLEPGDPNGISHVFRADTTNIGDWNSLPAKYFPFFDKSHVVDIYSIQSSSLLHNKIIIGGGGLISPHFKQLDILTNLGKKKVIGWGIGHNMIIDTKIGYIEKPDMIFPKYMKKFTLLGVRDYLENMRWVPCASCLSPLFIKRRKVIHDIVVFEHKRIPIKIHDFPKITNEVSNLATALDFLGSANIVITNSYHGAFWATLLGKGVLAFPFSSKFYAMKHQPVLCKPDSWKRNIDKCINYPEALHEARKANIDFYFDAYKHLSD